jgi:hypothetical protein
MKAAGIVVPLRPTMIATSRASLVHRNIPVPITMDVEALVVHKVLLLHHTMLVRKRMTSSLTQLLSRTLTVL